jgi:molybdate transport system substrate-binding protein
MTFIRPLLLTCLLLGAGSAVADKITIAAASDLHFAMDELISDFKKSHPADTVDAVYGSSGKFHTQLQQGAPYDLFFSADIRLPRDLAAQGLAASAVTPYAIGRIVLWSPTLDARRLTLASLTDPKITRIAIANPKHAPYGQRAEEALRAAGVWRTVESKLVYGENISQTAQFVQTGNAQIGILALSLALSPELAKQGGYWLIPDTLHAPLEQGYVITQNGANHPLARRFAEYLATAPARAILMRYGFALPGKGAGQ